MEFATQKLILPSGPALVPASQYDLEQIEKVPLKRTFLTRVTFNRTDPLHRWYWGFVGIIAEGIGRPAEWLHRNLKRDAGLIEHVFPEGIIVLKSTAKKAMDEVEFLAYVKLAKEIIFQRYIPDLNAMERRDVLRRVEEWTGVPCPW